MTRAAPFRIVHLSDLHLTARDQDRRTEIDFIGALENMNDTFRKLLATRLVQQAQLVLVTGDVSDTGHAECWRVFRRALLDAKLANRCLVVPGNHDVCHLGWPRVASRRHLIERDLEKMRTGLRIAGQPWKFPWARRPDRRLVIFGLQSSNPGNVSVTDNAVGELGMRQLEAFARLLRKHRDVPVKIVAMHHSPNIPAAETQRRRGRTPTGWSGRLLHQVEEADRRALRLLCLTHRVRLIVHGHLHLAEDRRVNGVRMIGAPASTEPVDEARPNVFRVYSYTVHGGGGRLVPKLHSVRL